MKNLKSGIIVVLLLVLGVVFVGCNTSSNDVYNLKRVNNAYITVDINPSIEIITDDKGLVAEVNGLNDDAISLLIDTDFTGKSVDVVIDEILELAIDHGYLDFNTENAILITTGAETPEETEELEKNVSLKVAAYIEERKMNVEVLKASLEATEGIKEVAAQYNISVGKVKIITRALAMDSELTFEAAAEMSVRDLNQIIREGIKELKDFYSEEIRGEFKKGKESLKVEFELKVLGLYNDAVQEAADDVFAEILEDSEMTVEELKALYLEYYNAMLEVEVPVDPVEEDEEVVEGIDRDEYLALKARRDEIDIRLKELQASIRTRSLKDLTDEELNEILAEMKELLLEKKDISIELNLGIWRFEDHMGRNHGDKNKHKDDYDLEDYYEEVKEHYEDLFEEYDVDLDDIEELFEDALEADIYELELELESQIQDLHAQFKVDSNALKVQIREENKILREVWKR